MIIALIPARGGSKRIPGKNIRPFLGKPIMAYSIEAAVKTGLFDKVIVSTDDEKIADVARSYGAEVPFIRPERLSDDHTGTDAVVRHCLEWHEKRGDIVTHICCIYATAPFVQVEDIIKGYEKVCEEGTASSFSVTPFEYPIYRGLKLSEDGHVEMIWPEYQSSRSQDLPEAYHDAGQFYWLNVSEMSEEGPLFFSRNARPVILPSWRVQDIDTLDDWKRAEQIFRMIEKKTKSKFIKKGGSSMTDSILMAGRPVGEKHPCFIIAEVGANHNRSYDLALRHIDAAVEAGADAVKFQIYSADSLYSKKTPRHSGYDKDLHTLISEIETPREWLPKLADYCNKKNILFFATPFDHEAVDELNKVSEFFKIASFELVDLDLVRYCASKGKPMIISTGLADMEEIEDAYRACVEAGNENIVFLQCASVYPAPPHIMNLKSMETIRRAFGTLVGLSDHTPGVHISVAAVAMGASVVEKHFTLDRSMEGPDHPFAIEPDELRELVRQIREVESAMGDGRKLGPSQEEMEFYQKARRSLHASRDIKAGETITEGMLTCKRPGLGIAPKHSDILVGRTAEIDIERDQWITWEMI